MTAAVSPREKSAPRSSASKPRRKPASVKPLKLGVASDDRPVKSDKEIRLLTEKMNKENRERFRSKYGFDIVSGEPIPGSKWKYTQL